MKLYGRCEQCKRKGFFIRKRSIFLPQMGEAVTSQKELCNNCYKGILFMLKQK